MHDYLVEAFVTLFVTVDPLGLAPVFLGLTLGSGPVERRRVAIRATLIATLVLVTFTLSGERLLTVLGITLPAFRIAGGLLLFHIAFQMVFSQKQPRDASDAERAVDLDRFSDIAAFPIAIPLLSGPGAISASILAAAKAPNLVAFGLFFGVIAIVMAISFAVFIAADRIDRRIGETGRVVIERLLGLLLAALSVQFVADGVKAIWAA
jgi:multiple antibiotic resistance protein